MRNVKLTADWAAYIKGQWVAVSDKIAENLIGQGIAIDPTRPKPEPIVEPAKPKAAKPKTKTKAKVRRK